MRILIGLLVIVLISGCSGKKDFKQMTFSGTMEMTEHVLGVKAAGRLVTLNVKEGDQVILTPPVDLADGQKVHVRPKPPT